MSKIVMLVGSPRRNGNTEKMAEAFTKGAKASGHEVTTFSIIDTRVNGCMACDYCMRNGGVCIQKDGMQDIYAALYEADTVVFATPVYFFGMSSQIKAIVDRFYASVARPFPITSAALLVALGGDPKTDAESTIATYKTIIDYIKWEDKGVVIAGEVIDKDDIDGKPALAEAEALGRNI